MASAQAPAPEGRSGRRPNAQGNFFSDSFRIRTVKDFGSRTRNRGFMDSRSACQRCRTRKSRCTVDESRTNAQSPGSTRCIQCRRVNAVCTWDKNDRRKRPKPSTGTSLATGTHAFEGDFVDHAPSQLSVVNESLLQTPIRAPPAQPQATPQSNCAPARPELQPFDNQRSSFIPADQLNMSDMPPPTQGLDSGDVHEPNMGLQDDSTQYESLQTYSLQPSDTAVFSDTWQLDPDSATPDWQGLQDFVLGLDFQGIDAEFPVTGNETPKMQAGTLQDPSNLREKPVPRFIRLRYYRRFGPTSVAPGLRSLSLVVERGEPEQTSPRDEPPFSERSSSHPLTTSTPGSIALDQTHIFDSTSGLPHAAILPQILDTFFEHFGGHFPFLHPQILGGHVKSGEASSFLLNAIAALTVRFCTFTGPVAEALSKYEHAWQRGATFLRQAKEQLVPLLSIPAPEVVAGLLILAWAEYGDDNETGMWMILGIAIRMAQDLGLHRAPEATVPDLNASFHDLARPNPDGSLVMTDEQSCIHQQKARMVMFWSVFIADVCVSLCTGRPTTIRRSDIGVSIPTVADMKIAQLDYTKEDSTASLVLPETVGVMLDMAEAVDTLNERGPATGEDLTEAIRTREKHLAELKRKLLANYGRLPPSVCFNAQNYAAASASRQHGLFLLLHLYFYTIIALLSTNESQTTQSSLELGQGREPAATTSSTDPRNGAVSNDYREAMMISQSTVHVLTVADIVNRRGFLATPFMNHCIFVTASMLLLDGRPPQKQTQQTSTSHSDTLPQYLSLGQSYSQQTQTSPQAQQSRPVDNVNGEGVSGSQQNRSGCGLEMLVAQSSYEFLREKLQDQAEYFGAVNTALGVLKGKENGMTGREAVEEMGTVDSSSSNRAAEVRDPGIVTRYTIIE